MDLAEARARATGVEVRHPWELARLEVVRRLIARHARLPPGSIVMDVGCGDVFVASQLAAAYPDVTFYAVDTVFTAEMIAEVSGRLAGNVHAFSSLDSIAPSGHPVALILLMDVIEHVDDDIGLLRGLLARPDVGVATTVLITVPAYQALFCAHDRFLGHYRRYSRRRLRAAVASAGLITVRSGTFFGSLLPIRLLQVVKERVLGKASDAGTTGLVTWDRGPARSALLKRMLVIDARAAMWLQRLGIPVPGLSLFAICRPSA